MFKRLTSTFLAFLSQWYDDEDLELESIIDFEIWERAYGDLFVPISEALDDSLDEALALQLFSAYTLHSGEFPLPPGFSNIGGPTIARAVDLDNVVLYDINFYVDKLSPAYLTEFDAKLTQFVGATIINVEQLVYPDEFKVEQDE